MSMRVFAHRGLSGLYPENTMEAFSAAALASFDAIELDVQLTRDGQVVIIHDETVDRTTDGSGLVLNYSLKELQRLNAAKIRSDQVLHTRIPTFTEYCEWASSIEGLMTNVEIKSSVIFYPELEEKTFAIIERYHLENRIFFSSFNHMSLVLLQQIAPGIPLGALVEEQGLMHAGFFCKRFGFNYFHPGLPSVSAETVNECHKHHIPVHVWTVDEKKDWDRMKTYGVDAVFTNYAPQTEM